MVSKSREGLDERVGEGVGGRGEVEADEVNGLAQSTIGLAITRSAGCEASRA